MEPQRKRTESPTTENTFDAKETTKDCQEQKNTTRTVVEAAETEYRNWAREMWKGGGGRENKSQNETHTQKGDGGGKEYIFLFSETTILSSLFPRKQKKRKKKAKYTTAEQADRQTDRQTDVCVPANEKVHMREHDVADVATVAEDAIEIVDERAQWRHAGQTDVLRHDEDGQRA